jgi:hypothetical protein
MVLMKLSGRASNTCTPSDFLNHSNGLFATDSNPNFVMKSRISAEDGNGFRGLSGCAHGCEMTIEGLSPNVTPSNRMFDPKTWFTNSVSGHHKPASQGRIKPASQFS